MQKPSMSTGCIVLWSSTLSPRRNSEILRKVALPQPSNQQQYQTLPAAETTAATATSTIAYH